MKTRFIIILIIVLSIGFSCDKMENEMPDVSFSIGSPVYMIDESTFYKFVEDSLYKCTPTGRELVEYSVEANKLLSSELTVEDMYSDVLFPVNAENYRVLTRYMLNFRAEGIADGIVVYYGDESRGGDSHDYADWPMAYGDAIPMNENDNTGSITYWYLEPGEYTATLVARNFWVLEEEAAEQNLTIEIEVLDKALYDFLDW